ncbi:hypothetical protein MNEG_0651, partial [Monoraphidium neglectum]
SSYLEGRFKMAERDRHRALRTAPTSTAAVPGAGGTAISVSSTGKTSGVPASGSAAVAAADAAMASLLEEEAAAAAAHEAAAERKKAKKKAKKGKSKK